MLKSKLDKYGEYYKTFAVIVVNVILLFILLNLFLYVLIVIKDSRLDNKGYSDELKKELYPDKSLKEINLILEEDFNMKFQYYPFIQYIYRNYSGQFVNIHEGGFRFVENQCGYPINENNYNIFIFGGSTTFGWGVADSETTPSKIQKILRENYPKKNVCVYNFANLGYYSSQEKEFFEILIKKNQIPDMAIFIDGLNDYTWAIEDKPGSSNRIAYYLSKDRLFNLANFPITRAIVYAGKKLMPKISDQTSGDEALIKNVDKILNTLEKNREMIRATSEAFNLKTYFVLQPIPTYNYDLSYHPITNNNPDILNYINNNKWMPQTIKWYSKLDESYNKLNQDEKKDIINLVNIQSDKKESLYVDSCHYNEKFSEELAYEIVEHIKQNI